MMQVTFYSVGILFSCYTLGFSSFSHSCFTWEIIQEQLLFECTVAESNIIKIMDSFRLITAMCTHLKSDPKCKTEDGNGVIKPLESRGVIYSLPIDDHVNGTWYCNYEKGELTTIVSTDKGIEVADKVTVEGRTKNFGNTTKAIIRAHTCYVPMGNISEVFINDKEFDILKFDKRNDVCFHIGDTPCIPEICNCSESGHEYSVAYTLKEDVSKHIFSFRMKFQDRSKRFFMTASCVFINGHCVHGNQSFKGKTELDVVTVKSISNTENTSPVTFPKTTRSSTTPANDTRNEYTSVAVIIIVVVMLFISLYKAQCSSGDTKGKNEVESNDSVSNTGSSNIETSLTNDTTDENEPLRSTRDHDETLTNTKEPNQVNEYTFKRISTNESQTNTDERSCFKEQSVDNDPPKSDQSELPRLGLALSKSIKIPKCNESSIICVCLKIIEKYFVMIVTEDVCDQRLVTYDIESNKYTEIHYFQHNYFKKLCYINSNKVAVFCPRKYTIDIFILNPGMIESRINLVEKVAVFASYNNQLYLVADNILKILTTEGLKRSTKTLQLHGLDDMEVDSERIICVCKDTVYCLNLDCIILWSFNFPSSSIPLTVLTDGFGFIYVVKSDLRNLTAIDIVNKEHNTEIPIPKNACTDDTLFGICLGTKNEEVYMYVYNRSQFEFSKWRLSPEIQNPRDPPSDLKA